MDHERMVQWSMSAETEEISYSGQKMIGIGRNWTRQKAMIGGEMGCLLKREPWR
jgi:hypothetical protein